MRTIAVLNQKGGVGKTTTVANTAAALAAAGARVVVIDFDPQAHLTIHLGLEPQIVDFGSYQVMTGSAEFEQQIMFMRLNLWLLPANINLVGAESELVSVVGRETILREAIQSSKGRFDYCLIDCSPSLGLLTLNALAAADDVLIPLLPHFLALQGLGKLLQTIKLVNRRINPELKVKWILLCMFDGRASLPNEVRADIEQFLRDARGVDCPWAQAEILPVHIRRNIKLAEAPSYGQTIFEYEPNCNGAEDYRRVAELIHAQYQGVSIDEVLQVRQGAQSGSPDVAQTDSQGRPGGVILQPGEQTPPKSSVIIQPGGRAPVDSPVIILPDSHKQPESSDAVQSTSEGQPDSGESAVTDEEQAKPPIEIKSISVEQQQESVQQSSEVTQTSNDQEHTESN